MIASIEGALPLPTTYAGALAEVDFWRRRNDDMELAARDEFRGDHTLDMPALWRWWIVEALAEYKIELRTVGEIAARMKAYRWSEAGENTDIEDAIVRDLEALAAQRYDPLDAGHVSREELVRQHGLDPTMRGVA